MKKNRNADGTEPSKAPKIGLARKRTGEKGERPDPHVALVSPFRLTQDAVEGLKDMKRWIPGGRPNRRSS